MGVGDSVLIWILALCCLVIGLWSTRNEARSLPSFDFVNPSITKPSFPNDFKGVSVFDKTVYPKNIIATGDFYRIISPSPQMVLLDIGTRQQWESLACPFEDFLFFVRGLINGKAFSMRQDFSVTSSLKQKRWSLPLIYKSHRKPGPSNPCCALNFRRYIRVFSFSNHPCTLRSDHMVRLQKSSLGCAAGSIGGASRLP